MATSTSKTALPFGSWHSPIDTNLVLSSAVNLAEARVAPNGGVAWLEGRPEEKGRNALVYRDLSSSSLEQVLPDVKWNARSRVHEYGGGSWSVDKKGDIVFSSVEGPAFRVRREGVGKWSEPEQITPQSDVFRYADFAPHPSQPNLTLAVLEDHTDDTPSTVVNTLVLLHGDKQQTTVASGTDFYASGRWSASGKFVCWISWTHPDMPWEGSELWVAKVNLDGEGKVDARSPLVQGSARKIAGEKNGVESVSQPRWALEGEKLVFLSDKSGFYELYEFDAEKRDEPKQVLKELPGKDTGGPDWIFGQSTHGPLSSSHWISSAGSGKVRVTSLSDDRSETIFRTPYVAFSDLHVVSPTQILVIGSPAAAPAVAALLTLPDLASLSSSTEEVELEEEVLKRSSSASVDPAFIPTGEAVTFPVTSFPSASGVGHALFYPPSSGTHTGLEGTLPPLITRCHGGPTASARRGLDWLVAYFCSRGFAFLDVDYGGSTGYGKDYRQRLEGKWGIVDVHDTIDAVEWAVRDKADKEKVAITGGSAGGFTVLAALCDSKVFTAGTSSYGISDLALLADDTHKFESQYLFKLLGGTPKEVPQNYSDRSPLNKASQITAPLLLLQGTLDKVVPPAQSELMLDRLRAAGGKGAIELFEGEGHGFRGKEARERAMKRELGWYRETWGIEAEEEK
ncbi:hypothetical protein JCM8547_007723 [Rhodosporidiobolus lusitaniae]